MAPVRTFALIAGIAYALVGLLGFIPGVVQTDAEVSGALRSGLPNTLSGRLLGLFPINLLHSIVHLAIGVWGLMSYRNVPLARGYARGLAILYLLLAVIGLIPISNPSTSSPSTTFGLIPVHSHDVWLHALTAALAGYFAFAPTRDDRRDVTTTTTTPPRTGI